MKRPSSKKAGNKPIPFIDLYCGAGGLSVGFEKAGFKSIFALDNDPSAVETYSYNHPDCVTLCEDVENITADKIRDLTGVTEIPLVVGGPNCQGVSLRGKRDPNDPKNKMFNHFHRLIKELNPKWFVMENVPGLLHRHNRELASDIFAAFENLGYHCGADVLLAADYGVPQLRYRLFLIGNRVDAPVVLPNPSHSCPFEELGLEETIFNRFPREKPRWPTVRDAIADLPVLANGGGSELVKNHFRAVEPANSFLKWVRGNALDLYNHVSHKTNDANIALIKHIPEGKNWKAIPENLRPERFKRVALKDHTTTYGRLCWSMPARTITCYFNNITCGAFTHPNQHRGISIREGARLQSFPDDFVFLGSPARQYRQVGNAVPCLLAQQVAQAVKYSMGFGETDKEVRLSAAVEFSRKTQSLIFNRPLKGMRFNLDKYLVR